MTAFEKHGFRDEELSRRHREYGFDCPAVDLDFVLIEYSHGLPVAIVEYKHWRAYGKIPIHHQSYKALSILATNSDIPFIIAYYWPENWSYIAQPINERAKRILRHERVASEHQWVNFLYLLRGEELPFEIAKILFRKRPPLEYCKKIA